MAREAAGGLPCRLIMYWQDEDKSDERPAVPEEIVDVVYGIACRSLPVDHAWALEQALAAALPWLADEPQAGMHPVHVPEAGNGWMRSEEPGALMFPSRRAHFWLRLPRARVSQALELAGRTLDVGGHRLEVQKASVRPLSAITTLIAHYVFSEAPREADFLAWAHAELSALGVRPKKMLCGKERAIATPDGPRRTRSLLLADLKVEESVRVQSRGLGPYRRLGCGLFVPHKGIREVYADQS